MENLKQKIFFYLPENSLFDATEHYCEIIKLAIMKFKDFKLVVVDNLDSMTPRDILITIRLHDAINLKVKPQKHIHWFQGIAPEEKVLLANGSLKSKISSIKTSYIEWKLLRKVDLCFFVSERMKIHYESKYCLDLNKKCIIMPCYNSKISKNIFCEIERYRRPWFVYAGSTAQWQCIEETLLAFNQIQRLINNAKLTIYTKESSYVEELIIKYSIKNVELKYVALSELQEELSKYKYAFLLRRDHIVNSVSTPTKMNSYLAAGLIPIYTSVIDSFEQNINLQNFSLKLDSLNPIKISQKVLKFENEVVNINELFNTYNNIFSKFYNDDFYIKLIFHKARKILYE